MVHLLDVNVLVALLDSAHEHHRPTNRWFLREQSNGWATCPITENGLIRVISGVTYPNLRITPGQAAASLRRLRHNFASTFHFWSDDVSLADAERFDLSILTGARQTTDAYLAGLAFRNSGRLATLDANIAWKSVNGASADLIRRLAP